jgi:hypothetical protein
VPRYEVRDATDGTVLGKHRTRQAALDGWRQLHTGKAVRVVRTYSDRPEQVVVEGTWHAGDDDADNALTR